METKNKNLLFYSAIIALIIISYLVNNHFLWSYFVWVYHPLHSAIEMLGTTLALFMVFILLQKQKREEKDEFFWIYIGFLGMNILNGFHAVSIEGHGFFLLSSTANMVGSFGFFLSWFSFPNKQILIKKWIICGVAVISVLFGISVLLHRDIFPIMMQNGKNTSTAIAYNFIAGLLYFISACFLLIKGIHKNFIKTEYRIFFFISLLFSLDAMSLKYSLPWNDIWWFWRLQHLLSYLFLLGYLTAKYLKMTFESEKIIHESEEKYRTMIEYSNDLIWALDRDGNVLYINKNAEDIGGYKTKDIAGKYFGLTIVPDDQNRIEKIFIDTLSGKPNNYEVKINVKDSKILVLSVNTAPIYEDGKIVGTISFGRDITEQKNTENELWETHGYLEKLFSYANVPIVVWDTNSNITRFNHAFEHLTGYEHTEVIGKKLDILFPDTSIDETLKKIKLTLSGGYWETVEIPILCKNKDVKIALWNSANIYAKDASTLVAIIAQGQDITERKKTENKLRETSDFLDNLFNCANAPIIVWSPNLAIVRSNHAFERLTGYNKEEIKGKNFYTFFNSFKNTKETLSNIKMTLSGEYTDTVEIPILCKNNEIKTVLWNSANIYVKDTKTIIATIAQGQDITERKKIDDEIKNALSKIKKSLEDTVHALTFISEIRDPFTAGHQIRVSKIACSIASELNLNAHQIEAIKVSGLLHDIGKISVPSEILTKPGKLNNIEIKLIRMHSKSGFDILKEIDFPWPVANIVLQHHERINGSGYPNGIKGEEILLEAKILAVADVIEAMSSHRPYRPAFSKIIALEEIASGKGVLYDPIIADACLKLFYDKKFKIE